MIRKGDTVTVRNETERFTVARTYMRGDAAIIADIVSIRTVKDCFTGREQPAEWRTVNLCKLCAA